MTDAWGWSPWFAWRPVRTLNAGWTWWRWIERRMRDDYGTHVGPEWSYWAAKRIRPFEHRRWIDAGWVPSGGIREWWWVYLRLWALTIRIDWHPQRISRYESKAPD